MEEAPGAAPAGTAPTDAPTAAAENPRPKFELPPLDWSAARLAKVALNADPNRGFVTAGRMLCCPLCNSPYCEPSCVMFSNSTQQQALYEYIVLHEPMQAPGQVSSFGDDGAELTPEQARQQLQEARELAVSSRTAQQKAQDLQDCRTLYGLAEGVLTPELVGSISAPGVAELITSIATDIQQQHTQEEQQLRAQGSSTQAGSNACLLIRWCLHRLLQLEVLEMTLLDLSLALKLLQMAKEKLPQPPSAAAAWGRASGAMAGRQGQWEVQEGIRRALQALSSQLSALQAAMESQPAKTRQLARYHREAREAEARRAETEFCLSWDYAEGGTSHPKAVDGAVTLFARIPPAGAPAGFSWLNMMTRGAHSSSSSSAQGTDSKRELQLALCKELGLPVPGAQSERGQQRQQRQERDRSRSRSAAGNVGSRGDGGTSDDDDEDESEEEYEEEYDDEFEPFSLLDAAGKVAAVLQYQPYQDYYEDGEYYTVTVQPGADAAKAKEAIQKLGWNVFELRHGVTTVPLPALPPRPPAAASAAAPGGGASSSSQQQQQGQVQAASAAGAAGSSRGAAAAAAAAGANAAAGSSDSSNSSGSDSYTVTITSGGAGSRHQNPSTLFVVREASGEGQEVAKALLTYSNPEMQRIGPALELIEVKGRWQKKGMGRRLMHVRGHLYHCQRF